MEPRITREHTPLTEDTIEEITERRAAQRRRQEDQEFDALLAVVHGHDWSASQVNEFLRAFRRVTDTGEIL